MFLDLSQLKTVVNLSNRIEFVLIALTRLSIRHGYVNRQFVVDLRDVVNLIIRYYTAPIHLQERQLVQLKLVGTSLNDQLLQGPDLSNDLIGILMRFRHERVALAADSEAMFHQTRVIQKDTDALRFLWWSGSLDNPPDEFQTLVHIFRASSSPCSANKSLKQIAFDNESKYCPEVIHTLRRDFYVDDVLKSVPTVRKAIWLMRKLI